MLKCKHLFFQGSLNQGEEPDPPQKCSGTATVVFSLLKKALNNYYGTLVANVEITKTCPEVEINPEILQNLYRTLRIRHSMAFSHIQYVHSKICPTKYKSHWQRRAGSNRSKFIIPKDYKYSKILNKFNYKSYFFVVSMLLG